MKILQLFKNRFATPVTLAVLVIAVFAFLLPDLTLAQAQTAAQGQVNSSATVVSTIETSLNAISSFLSVILYFLSYLIWPILVMIGSLMDSSLIFGGGMEERLLTLWAQIRNFVNLAFVVALVGIALYNIIGIDNEGNYAIKKILPKFILALVLVNFSFFATKLVIDAANVVTIAAFSLPNTVQQEFEIQSDSILNPDAICGTSIQKLYIPEEGSQTKVSTGQPFASICSNNQYTANARDFFQRFDSNNFALVMAVQFGQIPALLDPSDLVRQTPKLSNLAINILLSVALYVVYIAAFLSLLLVLVARLVVLWMVVALSPLAALTVILPDSLDSDFDVVKQFTSHVIAPIKIGLGLSIGYIMLSALQQVGPTSINNTIGQAFVTPFSGLNTLQEIIIAAGMVGVVYTVALKAAEGTLADTFVDSIRNFIGNQARFLGELPLSAPLIPVARTDGTSKNVSLSGLANRLRKEQSEFRQKGELDSVDTKGSKQEGKGKDHNYTDYGAVNSEIRSSLDNRSAARLAGLFANNRNNDDIIRQLNNDADLTVAKLDEILQKGTTLSPSNRKEFFDKLKVDPEADKDKKLSQISKVDIASMRDAFRYLDSKFPSHQDVTVGKEEKGDSGN